MMTLETRKLDQEYTPSTAVGSLSHGHRYVIVVFLKFLIFSLGSSHCAFFAAFGFSHPRFLTFFHIESLSPSMADWFVFGGAMVLPLVCVDSGLQTVEICTTKEPEELLRLLLARSLTPVGSNWDCGDDEQLRNDLLKFFPLLRGTLKAWRSYIDGLVEYPCYRLARHDLQHSGGAMFLSADQYVRQQFDSNLRLFNRSWSLGHAMSLRLRTAPLGDLTLAELVELRNLLTAGWGEENKPDLGQLFKPSPLSWFTPAHRSQILCVMLFLIKLTSSVLFHSAYSSCSSRTVRDSII